MQYYQQQPHWGTSGYQMIQPPRPVFQPQPNWGGSQYFRAQAGAGYEYEEDGFFDNMWRGIKDIFSRGFSRPDAQLWHQRVYGGMAPIDEIGGAELGAAAGYEAVRHWQTYRSTYRSPLADDREREKEALAGLAAGEAVKLVSYSQRVRSRHTRREAAEIAAATAERIFAEDFDDPYEMFEQRNTLRRRGSRGVLRRRSQSFVGQAPLVASTTGGYVSAQPTGYVSSQATGTVYGQPGQQVMYSQSQTVAAQPQYVQAQPQYVSATGQPVQYMSSTGQYMQQPQYVTPTGQPIQYATTGGVQYATTGYGQTPQYVQQPGVQYAATGVQYAQPGVQYASTGGSYMTVPQGYTRARALSTGAPGVYYR